MGIKSASRTQLDSHFDADWAVLSQPGRGKVNEDNFLLIPELKVIAVSDGLGGHDAGDVASSVVVSAVDEYCIEQLPTTSEEDLKACLAGACQVAHRAVVDRGSSTDSRQMGATLVLVHIRNNKAYVAHVGDSRAYIKRGATVQLLTEDHSLVMSMVNAGRLTLEEARSHPKKNVVTQALGSASAIVPSIRSVPVEQGDTLLLCSDGLWETLAPEELEDLLDCLKEPKVVCKALLEKALANGADDDVTIAVMDL